MDSRASICKCSSPLLIHAYQMFDPLSAGLMASPFGAVLVPMYMCLCTHC